ncbi:MAG: NUDIX domain-containing protein [Treponema sp.]|nr:NUDIX domain-containing protein [Treponema sp.]
MSRSIACIDYRDGKIFIAKRQMVGDMGGRWEFPGGKIEEGEDLPQAVIREMNEEFGVTVTVGKKITSGTFTHKGKPCTLDVLEVHFPHDGFKTRFTLTEHTDYKWENIENIPELDFVDSDLAVYDAVKKWCKNENV